MLRMDRSMSALAIYHSLSHIFFEVRDRFIWKLKLRARCCCQRLQVSQKNMKSEMAAKCLTRRRSDPGDRNSRSDLQTQVTLRSSSAPGETRDCQSGFNSLNALESGFHGHSGSGDFALYVSEQIARLVVLIDGEFSHG